MPARRAPSIALLAIGVAMLSAPVSAQTSKSLRRATFDTMWTTINETFYDSTFGGVNWKAAHDKYLPLALAAKNDDEFYRVAKEMMELLKVSHLTAGPASALRKYNPPAASAGLDVRSIDGRIVVVKVIAAFPAARAGIRAGYVVTSIDGKAPRDLQSAIEDLGGPAGARVRLKYLDEKDVERTVTLTRQAVSASDRSHLGNLNAYSFFETTRLPGGIGYIRFTSFLSFLGDRIDAAFESMHDAPGIILDLRGNSGGEDLLALRIDNTLFDRETQLMISRRRDGESRDLKAAGSERAYRGKLVILVDERCGSNCEDMTAGLQEAGRAYVIGTQTMGRDLDALIKTLPDGGIMEYPIGLPHTPRGFIIEGHGVTPDLIVHLTRADLLSGHDTQLEAALAYLRR